MQEAGLDGPSKGAYRCQTLLTVSAFSFSKLKMNSWAFPCLCICCASCAPNRFQVQQQENSDEEVAQAINQKLGDTPGISYAEIAARAYECGRTELAIKVQGKRGSCDAEGGRRVTTTEASVLTSLGQMRRDPGTDLSTHIASRCLGCVTSDSSLLCEWMLLHMNALPVES